MIISNMPSRDSGMVADWGSGVVSFEIIVQSMGGRLLHCGWGLRKAWGVCGRCGTNIAPCVCICCIPLTYLHLLHSFHVFVFIVFSQRSFWYWGDRHGGQRLLNISGPKSSG